MVSSAAPIAAAPAASLAGDEHARGFVARAGDAEARPVGPDPVDTRAPDVDVESVLVLQGVGKRFGSVVALDSVDLQVRRGEVHCLLGENGAGKSTLCNIIFGVHRPSHGRLTLRGAPFAPVRPADALGAGVAMVHQHFSLVGNLSALENFRLGRSRQRALGVAARARVLCERFGFSLELDRPVEQLSVGERQRVEIVKCLLDDPALLVLDEPTAVLPPPQIEGLLAVCRQVAESGCGVLLVTHKLAEIGAVAQRTSVLRKGRVVETVEMRGADMNALVRAMVGREVRPLARAGVAAAATAREAAAPLLGVDAVRSVDRLGVERLHASFSVAAGEVVGIAGVEGNGQSELASILSGMCRATSGTVRLAGTDVTGWAPRALTRLGVGCITEDRHATGCHVGLSVAENLFLGSLARFTRFGFLDRARLNHAAEALLRSFEVRGTPEAPMGSLSGGNQQKVVLARELSLEPLTFLLAAQPTRGLDVGAVEAVYTFIRRARERGVGVLLISSELEELSNVCDRVLVMYRGKIVGEVPGGPGQQEIVGRLMSGQAPPEERAA